MPWTPNIDTYARDDEFLIKCELAGLHPGNIELTVEGRQVLIQGQRNDEDQQQGSATEPGRQIHYGLFQAAVYVASHYDLGNATAQYQNGFLWIRVPRGGGQSGQLGIVLRQWGDAVQSSSAEPLRWRLG